MESRSILLPPTRTLIPKTVVLCCKLNILSGKLVDLVKFSKIISEPEKLSRKMLVLNFRGWARLRDIQDYFRAASIIRRFPFSVCLPSILIVPLSSGPAKAAWWNFYFHCGFLIILFFLPSLVYFYSAVAPCFAIVYIFFLCFCFSVSPPTFADHMKPRYEARN